MLKIRIDFPGHNSISCDKRKRKFILEIEENKRENKRKIELQLKTKMTGNIERSETDK